MPDEIPNRKPIARQDSVTVLEGKMAIIDVLANDSDPDMSVGDSIAIVDASIIGPKELGYVTIVDNNLNYYIGDLVNKALDKGDSIPVAINYTIEDEHTLSSSSKVVVTIMGTKDNLTAGIENVGPFIIYEGFTIAVDVSKKEYGLSGKTIAVVSATKDGDFGGTIDIVQDTTIRFNTGSDFSYLITGERFEVQINYTVKDENNARADSFIQIVIVGAGDDPTANIDTVTTSKDHAVTIDVLANDSLRTNIPKDHLTITKAEVVGSGNGSVSIVDNELLYDAKINYTDPHDVTINYTIQGLDSSSQSSSRVTVKIR